MSVNGNISQGADVEALLNMAIEGQDWVPIVAPHFWEKDWLDTCRKLVDLAPYHSQMLLEQSMQYLPEEWGQLFREFHGQGDELIVLLQDNYWNWRARLNQAHILKALTYSHCVILVASAGASGAVDTSSISHHPDRRTRLKTALVFLKSLELTAEEFCQIVDKSDFTIWGVEDKALYTKQLNLSAEGESTELWKTYAAVPAIYTNNVLRKMDERKISVAILTTGSFNLEGVRKELENMSISYFWIIAEAEGPDNVEEHEILLKGERRSVNELLQELDDEEIPEF